MAFRRSTPPHGLRGPLALALILFSAGCGDDDHDAPPTGEPKNVLLISLDSTRRDLLSAYGHDAPHAPGVPSSPHLDALAAEGAVMLDAYATTSWTLPSHMTLLTGQPEVVHAVEIDHLRPDPARSTLASVLQDRGYQTSGFFTGPYLDPRWGFAKGFDRYEACFGPALTDATARMKDAQERQKQAEARRDFAAAKAAWEEARAAEQEVDTLSHRDVSSDTVVDRAIDAIEAANAADEPFFVFAHFFDPHYDYVPPAEHDLFDPSYDGPIDGKEFFVNEAISKFAQTPSGRERVVDERGLEHVLALYAGELRWTDSEVGRLLAKLDELGLADDTLVIVTSDHGDEFFEHGGIGHRRTLHEEVVRIPMILRMPGVVPAGARVDGLVSNVDLFGTVLELLGFRAVQGVRSNSLAPLIRGDDDGADRTVLGRLVTVKQAMIGLPPAPEPIPALVYAVEETYRVGRVKIQRRRQWPEPSAELPEGLAAKFSEVTRAGRDTEVVRWIDVESYPDEPDSAWSTDFSSGPPRAALQRFHDEYGSLLNDRRSAGTADPDEDPIAGMAALGYTDAATTVQSERFVLPPPGAQVLGER